MDSPGKTLAEAASAAPAGALPGQPAQRQQSVPPLSPRVPTPSTTLEPRLGRHLRGGMQIFVKIIRTQDQMRTRRRRPSTRSLPRESTRPPARSLPGTTAMPRQDPCRGHLRGYSQTHICQDSTAVPIQLPAQPVGQAPAWQRAASRPTQQAPAWWHADLHEDPTTAPPQRPVCLHGTTCTAGLGACRSEARRQRTGRAPFPSPIKLRDT